MNLPPFTFGVGDRFGHEAEAQLSALQAIAASGTLVHPVWNKSNREHTLIGSEPAQVRACADAATAALGWTHPYFVDADHIGLATVDRFLEASDFFTLDVAAQIGQPADPADVEAFIARLRPRFGPLAIPGLAEPLVLDAAGATRAAAKFLAAAREAGRIHRHIAARKGEDGCVAEVSMDETDEPQSPAELLYILAMLAQEGVPVRTIAPKFFGRFNKGVDYVGDLDRFAREFEDDLCVLAWAVKEFGLPAGLKLSVHSGSDKFSLYPIIRRLIHKHGAGLHLKTAGTTWLEEVIGLAEAGSEGLVIARDLYRKALEHFEELTAPYATVIDVRRDRLPTAEEVAGWDSETYAAALRHEPGHPGFNPDFRQLLHVSFKLAAKMGPRFTRALKEFRAPIARNVTHNLLERHLRPLFGLA